MNKYEKAIKELQSGIISFCTSIIKEAPFDKTVIGQIKSVSNNKYSVEINGSIYNNVPKLSNITLSVNDIVKITVPQNSMNNMYIEGKLG